MTSGTNSRGAKRFTESGFYPVAPSGNVNFLSCPKFDSQPQSGFLNISRYYTDLSRIVPKLVGPKKEKFKHIASRSALSLKFHTLLVHIVYVDNG